MTAQYFEVKQEHTVPHVTAAGGDYSVLKRDNIPHVPLHNLTAGDYSALKRDDVPHSPPYSIAPGGNYFVLKREEREVS